LDSVVYLRYTEAESKEKHLVWGPMPEGADLMSISSRVQHCYGRIKKGWGIGGKRKGGALEDKERAGHWRIKKGWGIGG
jgi:hypothetical protein